MQPSLAYLLELRLQARGRPEAMAIIDRCLALIARATDADLETLVSLDHEVAAIADELALRYGAPKTAGLQ